MHRKAAMNSSHLLHPNPKSCYNIISVLAMLPKPRAQASKVVSDAIYRCLYYDLGIK